MEILFSLVEFLIMLVGIAAPLAILCVCLPVIYFILSIVWSLLMDKLHPKPEPPPPRPAILLSPAPFWRDLPSSPEHRIFRLSPYDSEAYVDFDEFTMTFLRRMFRSSPFVVEQFQYRCDDNRFPPKDEDYVIEFQQKGGQLFSPNERTVFAVTTPHLPRLYEFIDQMDQEFFWYELFELPIPLSSEQLSDPTFDIQSVNFTCHICVNLEPGHEYIQIETQQTVISFLDFIWTLCRQMDRELVLSPQTPKSKDENNAAQS